ncbi:hypothetical protein SEA_GARDENSTATE_49 [Microbacterium phage GardenState]|uniref:Uncharacterized protein n=1 Tax=Microbacterium phage GardenState TaxID=2776841 RepID=A0A7L8ZE92_9CAUD|nr:hypothetical protein SEA_GARDENSTATE_49 [Microbacterium phage GardenState]
MTASSTAARIRSMGEAVIHLADSLAHAEEVQYLKPAAPSTRQDTPEKAKGGVSRPTEDIALDPRRLALRARVIEAEQLTDGISARAEAAANALDAALREWAGQRA